MRQRAVMLAQRRRERHPVQHARQVVVRRPKGARGVIIIIRPMGTVLARIRREHRRTA